MYSVKKKKSFKCMANRDLFCSCNYARCITDMTSGEVEDQFEVQQKNRHLSGRLKLYEYIIEVFL